MNIRNFYLKFHFFIFPLMLGVAFFLFHRFIFEKRLREIEKISEEVGKRQKIVQLYGKKVELEGELNQLVNRFPQSTDFKWLITSVSSITKRENIEIISIKPLGIKRSNFYKEIAVDLELEGSYHQIGRLVAAIDNSESFLEIRSLKMSPKYIQEKGKGTQSLARAKDSNVLLDCNIEIATIIPNL